MIFRSMFLILCHNINSGPSAIISDHLIGIWIFYMINSVRQDKQDKTRISSNYYYCYFFYWLSVQCSLCDRFILFHDIFNWIKLMVVYFDGIFWGNLISFSPFWRKNTCMTTHFRATICFAPPDGRERHFTLAQSLAT